jgi:uncharacterized membrane protein YhaH (DUF805 family)
MNWFMESMRKYADFSGRARRMEYWMFQLFACLISVGLALVAIVAVLVMGNTSGNNAAILLILAPIWLFLMATIIPHLSVLVRRLHDTGRSGWYYFISFIPLVGPIILLVYLFSDSQPGPNMYGPNPKGMNAYPPMMPQYPGVYPPAQG